MLCFGFLYSFNNHGFRIVVRTGFGIIGRIIGFFVIEFVRTQHSKMRNKLAHGIIAVIILNRARSTIHTIIGFVQPPFKIERIEIQFTIGIFHYNYQIIALVSNRRRPYSTHFFRIEYLLGCLQLKFRSRSEQPESIGHAIDGLKGFEQLFFRSCSTVVGVNALRGHHPSGIFFVHSYIAKIALAVTLNQKSVERRYIIKIFIPMNAHSQGATIWESDCYRARIGLNGPCTPGRCQHKAGCQKQTNK